MKKRYGVSDPLIFYQHFHSWFCLFLTFFLKANHIASEQKRRQAIREGFDKITAIVPDLKQSQGRSEATVLTESK